MYNEENINKLAELWKQEAEIKGKMEAEFDAAKEALGSYEAKISYDDMIPNGIRKAWHDCYSIAFYYEDPEMSERIEAIRGCFSIIEFLRYNEWI